MGHSAHSYYRKGCIYTYSAKKKHLYRSAVDALKRFQSFRSQVALMLGWRVVIKATS